MRTTSLIDVDNTLIDNDVAKVEIDRRLDALLGDTGSDRFWAVYEAVRAELGVVDIPRAIARWLGPDASLAQRVALAELFMQFPFADFVLPGAVAMIDRLSREGSVVILSDGDPVFQPSKIHRAGLADAVDGHVLIYEHKEEHLLEIGAAFPADRFLLIDDKPGVIDRVRERADALMAPLVTVLVRQGKYAAAIPPGPWSGADYTAERIGDVIAVLGLDG